MKPSALRSAGTRARARAAAHEKPHLDLASSLVWVRIGWLAALALWLFLTLSLVGFNAGDPPGVAVYPPNEPVINWCGKAGSVAAFYTYQMFGYGAWVLVAMAGLWLAVTATGRSVPHISVRILGSLMLAAACSGMQAFAFPNSGPVPLLPGGLIGAVKGV